MQGAVLPAGAGGEKPPIFPASGAGAPSQVLARMSIIIPLPERGRTRQRLKKFYSLRDVAPSDGADS